MKKIQIILLMLLITGCPDNSNSNNDDLIGTWIQDGIVSIIKQENLSALAGIMSPGRCMAELWILNDEDESDEEKVQEIEDAYLKGIKG